MAVVYFDIAHAVRVHDGILALSGGSPWIKDIWNLESALSTIQNDDYCPTFEEKLEKLVYSVNKNHSFEDANKRTSIALGAYFLEVNGYGYAIDRFICEMENIAVAVADNKIGRWLLLKIMESFLYEDSFSEGLQLELIQALSENEQ